MKPKRCLVLSLGPPPNRSQEIVEGGGLRCWGLAVGLAVADPTLDVGLAYQSSFGAAAIGATDYRNLRVFAWSYQTLREAVQSADAVIVSYCMGDLTEFVVDCIRPDQQLVLDCYVPIHVEVAARRSLEPLAEQTSFIAELPRWTKALRRGDLFLCAGQGQQQYYRGVLAAVGRLNPLTYTDVTVLDVPFGVHRGSAFAQRSPMTDTVGASVRKLLWFGGTYPWFDPSTLVAAVEAVNQSIPCALFVVGGINPFVVNPDFKAHYDEVVRQAAARPNAAHVYLHDWVPYRERCDWYGDADAVILVNQHGQENTVAWRTRLADYVWAEAPILTTGEDQLSAWLLERGAAARLDRGSADTMSESLVRFMEDPLKAERLREACRELKSHLYWDEIVKPLALAIAESRRSTDLLTSFETPLGAGHDRGVLGVHRPRLLGRGKEIWSYGRRVGFAEVLRVAADRIQISPARRIAARQRPRLVVLTHMLDHSGAPLVASEIAKEAVARRPGSDIHVYTHEPVERGIALDLRKNGVHVTVLPRFGDMPRLGRGDVVVVNTAAHHPRVMRALFEMARSNKIGNLFWYIHEGPPEKWMTAEFRDQARSLTASSRLTILIAGRELRQSYVTYLGSDTGIVLHGYRIDVPGVSPVGRTPGDFNSLRFVMPGTLVDGRKGQLAIFYAFCAFKRLFFDTNPSGYRDFSLWLVGLEDNYISEQVRRHAGALGEHCKLLPRASRVDTLGLLRSANITVCYSISESLPIFVFEGMLNGHPILRNDCSGLEEQLIPGANGFALPSNDFWGVVRVVESVANRTTTSNETLAAMSRRSIELANSARADNWLGIVDERLRGPSRDTWDL